MNTVVKGSRRSVGDSLSYFDYSSFSYASTWHERSNITF